MKTYWRSATTAGLTVLIASCASPMTHYYVLAPVPSSSGVASDRGPFKVDAVLVPDELDRLQIVQAIDPTQRAISGLNLWAAPLDQQLQTVLTQDLALRTHVGRSQPDPSIPRKIIAVDIVRFDGDLRGHVRLTANWSVTLSGHKLPSQTEQIETDAGGADISLLPQAMSEAVGILADHIADAY